MLFGIVYDTIQYQTQPSPKKPLEEFVYQIKAHCSSTYSPNQTSWSQFWTLHCKMYDWVLYNLAIKMHFPFIRIMSLPLGLDVKMWRKQPIKVAFNIHTDKQTLFKRRARNDWCDELIFLYIFNALHMERSPRQGFGFQKERYGWNMYTVLKRIVDRWEKRSVGGKHRKIAAIKCYVMQKRLFFLMSPHGTMNEYD